MLAVVFPTPYVNRSLRIASRSAITLLTLSAPGRTIYGTIAGLAASSYAEFPYTSDDNAWFRMG
ncbi:hypothetical protein [Sphingobium yanoikuyae]|uniref:hypothetical protein n=1 Tax=Sphingobium yanoikuyae TaxID=13690 RepID=UPI0028B0DC7A|nr:hypothetical protein [Sphingobium yanoikuyae]